MENFKYVLLGLIFVALIFVIILILSLFGVITVNADEIQTLARIVA